MKIRASGFIAPDLIAAVPTELDDENPYSRFLMFENNTDELIGDADIPRTVVDACAFPYESNNENIFVLLSNEGDVYFMTDDIYNEKIPGAGVLSEDAENLGSTLGIAQVNGVLYVCGDGSQIYYRSEKATWIRVGARGIDDLPDNFFESIAAVDPSMIAACGYTRGKPGRPATGCLCYYAGGRWQSAELPNNQYMHSVTFLDKNRLVAVGGGGTIVAGVPDSLEDRSIPNLMEKFLCARLDRSKVHVLGQTAVYILDSRLSLVETLPLPSNFSSPKNIEVKEGIIWYFDRNGLARYDASGWTVMPIAANFLERP